MDSLNYREITKGFIAKKSFGQNFLINQEIAASEAKYAKSLNVLELGPGLGILTKELCNTAKRVVAIEKDSRLCEFLKKEIDSKKLVLIENDFFSVDMELLRPVDIMISNIPYNLSSKTIYWLSANQIPALLCLQKEFADHIFAKPGSKSYSRLSVLCSLGFRLHRIREVSAGNFYPMPKVDSSIIYLIPKEIHFEEQILAVISSIMNHKKKRLKNSVIDSAAGFGIGKAQARQIANSLNNQEKRPFQMEPELILQTAKEIKAALDSAGTQKE